MATKSDRKRTPADRLVMANKRWSDAYKNAQTSAERLAAAYDWCRAASRYAADLGAPELGEMYREAAAKGLASTANDLVAEMQALLS